MLPCNCLICQKVFCSGSHCVDMHTNIYKYIQIHIYTTLLTSPNIYNQWISSLSATLADSWDLPLERTSNNRWLRAFVPVLVPLCEGHKSAPTRAMEINHQRPLCNLRRGHVAPYVYQKADQKVQKGSSPVEIWWTWIGLYQNNQHDSTCIKYMWPIPKHSSLIVDPCCNPYPQSPEFIIAGCLVHLQFRLGHLEFEWKMHVELLLSRCSQKEPWEHTSFSLQNFQN